MAHSIFTTILKKWKRELILGVLVSSVFASSWITLRDQKIVQDIIERRSEQEQKLRDIRSLITRYPDSRDLLYRQALLEWELGNDEEASRAIERARYLDPNNPILPTLEQLPHRP